MLGQSVRVLLLLAAPCFCAGAEGPWSVPRNPQPVAIDGEIEVLEWAVAAVHPLSTEIDPQRVVPTAWQTTVRMAHDGRNLLLAFDATDQTPDRIVAARGARDTISNEDYVVVQIDAEGSRQRHYEFRVNAAGVLDDRIVGGSSAGSPQWSGTWTAAAKRNASGYMVEISIPLTTLNVHTAADGSLALSLNVTRHIGRDRRETVSLLPVNTTEVCQECQYEPFALPDVDGERQGLELRPYLAVRRASQYPVNAPATSDNSIDPGIDVLWRLGGGRKIVATLNPDFSEVAPDQIQFDVNRRFAVSFAENRPFFTENAGAFGAQIPLVYTRSIADPAAALAYSAQTPRTSSAVLYSADRVTSFIVPSQTGSRLVAIDDESQTMLGRLQANGAGGQRAGVLLTGRRATDYYNVVAAADGRKPFGEHHALQGLAAVSRAGAGSQLAADFGLPEESKGSAMQVGYNYRQEHHGSNTSVNHSTSGFRADAGNLNRVGTTSAFHEWYWNLTRPAGHRISTYGGGVWGDFLDLTHERDGEWNLETWGYMTFAGGSGVDSYLHFTHEIYQGRIFDQFNVGMSWGWQINEKIRVFGGINRVELIDLQTAEPADSIRPFFGFNLKAGSTLSMSGNYEFDNTDGQTTRNYRTGFALLRANWSPRLGHTLSVVGNWGGTHEVHKLTMEPDTRSDRAVAQLVYLYQRADRSSFQIGINAGSTGDEGPGSMHKSSQLVFSKLILDLSFGD